jgi:hypothetical protein
MSRGAPPASRRAHAIRTSVLGALGLASLAGCFQELDAGASSGSAATLSAPPTHTVDLMTPSIGYGTPDDAQETDDPCTATTFHAMETLRADCAPCHGGGPGQNLGVPPFDYVLDVSKLLTAVSQTVKDPVTMQPVRFLVPGDPDHSRLYVRMFKREMPPGDVVGLPPNPNRPTVSDISVMRQWISHCLGTNARDGQDDGQGNGQGNDQGQDMPPASGDAAAAPAGEVDAAAADRDGGSSPVDARGGGTGLSGQAGSSGAGGPTSDGGARDGGAADGGPRRRDGGVRGGG